PLSPGESQLGVERRRLAASVHLDADARQHHAPVQQDAVVYGTGAGVGLGSGAPALNAVDHTHYFTGRSDNFDPSKSSTNPANARLDPTGIPAANHRPSVIIPDAD